jgi:hypothetical protein
MQHHMLLNDLTFKQSGNYCTVVLSEMTDANNSEVPPMDWEIRSIPFILM